ncbi:N-formylglutamate deformylase [Methylobacterium terrae]|uniref:N-formylglutamate deformylase n=1 Tax=Methylobacterium terrae TaxID=2202827 RepID=A0A2U8WIV8_9HYPH|nr:N-formylglutamate deformylase [Methylobacterium terrae]AWN46164.1 N-formylglutamate deformylase [Methylobacterium terrae]
MSPFEVARGSSPVILAFPHTGTWLPPDILARLNDEGSRLRDTDWHIHRLYERLLPDATTVRATVHRYAIDANRDPTGASLYPGQNTTGLVPLTDFDGAPIWREGAGPGEADVADRVARFHAPYHAALAGEIARVRAWHGIAVLYDCHSIRSRIPFLFPGTLPDFNIGTDGGRTCDPAIERAAADICAAADGYTSVVNGRFRGGWTTRRYGRPEAGIHAIQMELAQVSHLTTEAPPFALDADKAARLRPVLGAVLGRLAAAAEALKGA